MGAFALVVKEETEARGPCASHTGHAATAATPATPAAGLGLRLCSLQALPDSSLGQAVHCSCVCPTGRGRTVSGWVLTAAL